MLGGHGCELLDTKADLALGGDETALDALGEGLRVSAVGLADAFDARGQVGFSLVSGGVGLGEGVADGLDGAGDVVDIAIGLAEFMPLQFHAEAVQHGCLGDGLAVVGGLGVAELLDGALCEVGCGLHTLRGVVAPSVLVLLEAQ